MFSFFRPKVARHNGGPTNQFAEGVAYEAIPAIEGARRRLVVCIGRDESTVQLSWADDLTTDHIQVCAGRETVKPIRPDGVYFISSAVPLDVNAAAPIIDLLRKEVSCTKS